MFQEQSEKEYHPKRHRGLAHSDDGDPDIAPQILDSSHCFRPELPYRAQCALSGCLILVQSLRKPSGSVHFAENKGADSNCGLALRLLYWIPSYTGKSERGVFNHHARCNRGTDNID